MPVADTRIKSYAFPAQLLINILYNLPRLICRNMVCAEVTHKDPSIRLTEGNEIASKGQIIWAKLNPHACCLKRRPACVIFFWVITEDTQDSHIASRRIALRHILHKADLAFLNKHVHIWRF